MPPGVVDRVTFGVYDPHAASAIDEALGEMQVRWHGLDHPVLEVAARDWGMLGELRDVLDSLHASAAGSPISPDDLCLLLAGLGFADATTEDD